MRLKSSIYAANLHRNDLVDMYGQTWRIVGLYDLYDGTFECPRVFLVSVSDPRRITFVHAYSEFYKIGENIYKLID